MPSEPTAWPSYSFQRMDVAMAPYSMDLRKRVARAWVVSGDSEEIPL
jgi:hypothetical protein